MSSANLSRRDFLKFSGLAGLGGLAACTTAKDSSPTPAPADEHSGMGEAGGDMDAMHEAGVKIFLDNAGKDASFWNNMMPFTQEDGFKVFDVVCQEVQWEVAPGKMTQAFTYNGVAPGQQIRIVEGDNVRVRVKNEMTQSTAVHFHGVLLPNNMDGVPFITQPPIKPGETFTYEFTARNPGTHIYHSHHNATEQVTKGMFGPFIIEPKDKTADPAYDSEYVIVLNDTGLGLTINGKSFPYTQPIIAKLGEKVRIRYMNEGLMLHPMHLHGIEQVVFAKDGWTLPAPYTCDTLNIAPGERYDVLVNCHTPGAWAFHCHVLSHAESPQGMFGMVIALVIQE